MSSTVAERCAVVTRRPWGRALALSMALAGCMAAAGQPGPQRDGDGAGSSGAAMPATGTPTASTTVPAPQDGPGTGPLPTLLPDEVLARVPTRVRVSDLGIDLPVVAPPPDPSHYPFCGVAEFLPTLSVPGRPGTTFLYAHARAGMFLRILEASRAAGGRSMLGDRIEVYTSDDRVFDYRVIDVQRHVTSLDAAYKATGEQLILQTSEGPHGTIPKTMVIAAPSGEEAADHGEAHPRAQAVTCDP